MKNKREEVSESDESDNNKSHRSIIKDSIGENDDVYLLELPKAIDVSWLVGKPINFDDITKLKLFKKKYLVESISEGSREINLQTRKLRSVTIRKSFTIREYIKKKRSIESSLESHAFKSNLPDNLKIRHPLFGADYKSKVVLEDYVMAKLDGLLQEENKKKSKKKKNKKTKPNREVPVADVNESIFGLLESHLTKLFEIMKNKREEVSESDESDNNKSHRSIMNNSQQNHHISSSDEEVTRTPQKRVNLSPIKEYKQQNRDCTTYSLEDSIGENDDVYLLELPKAIDVSWLVGKPINFDDITKLKLFKKKYLIESISEGSREINLQTRKLRSVTIRKTFTIREYIKKKRSIDNSLESHAFKSNLPNNLKIRHPLFGADYKSKVVLEDSVMAKLDGLLQEENKRKSKKNKNKKTKPAREEPVEDVNESIFGLLESHLKKKRNIDEVDLSQEYEIDPVSTKSNNHKKIASHAEIAAEDNFLYSNKTDKHKKDDSHAQITTEGNQVYNKPNKREKHKKDDTHVQISSEVKSVYNKPNKREKHKKDYRHAQIVTEDDTVSSKPNKRIKHKKDDSYMPTASEVISVYNKPNKTLKLKKGDSYMQIADEDETMYDKPSKREKHKKDHSHALIASEDISVYDKVNKTVKHKIDGSYTQTTQEDTVYNKPNKREKSKKQIIAEENSVYNTPNKSEKQKQKKSKERPVQIKIEPPSPPPYKKKRESTLGFANSTVLNLQLPLFDVDLSQIDNNPSTSSGGKPKKVKKERRFSQSFSEFEDDFPKNRINMKKEKMFDNQSNYEDDDTQFDDSIQQNLKLKKSKRKLDTSTSEFLNHADTESRNISNKKKKIKSEYISEAEDEQPKKKKRRVKSESQFRQDDDEMMNNILQNLKSEFGKSF